MTLSMLTERTEPGVVPDGSAGDWAVVRLRPDGTLGRATIVAAEGPAEAADAARAQQAACDVVVPPGLSLRVGLQHATDGHLARAARSFGQGARTAAGRAERLDCLGHLALAEAELGDLQLARGHAQEVLRASGADGTRRLAQVASARVHLERAELEACARMLDAARSSDDATAWVSTCTLVVEAELLVATGRPEAATRLLARASDDADGPTGWAAARLRTARADALLACGEPLRALTVVTPLPPTDEVEASVVTAAGRQALGDHRGAASVLAGVAAALEGASLQVQVRAWLIEAHLAHDRGHPERTTALVERSLAACGAEGLRRPLQRDRGWLQAHAELGPRTRHAHLDVLQELVGPPAPRGTLPRPRVARSADPTAGGVELLGDGLTDRETQVLELLAQMCSTEEIAAALYVSVNTVKTHLKGIFGKLCVNRRVDAVRRGRRLGLC